jgi:mono/diheme cytochrome c family protein
MRTRVLWGLAALLGVAAVIVLPAMAAGGKSAQPSVRSQPGNVANGKVVYVKYCGKCHSLSDAGARGTLGNNLDHVDVTFSCTVSAIENGVGGIQAEYVLRNVSFQQVYDVAAYVSKVSKKIGTTPCTSIG